jgi:hypothetical protein
MHLDSTGQLVRKPDSVCPLVMNHAIIIQLRSNDKNPHSILYPVAEMITCDQTSLNIENFLRSILSNFTKISTVFTNLADYIVVDWSFAEFNAIIKMNMMSFVEYLDKMYTMMETRDVSVLNDLCCVASCCSHLTKMVLDDVRSSFKDKNTQNFITDLIMEIMSIETFEAMDNFISDILVILKKQKKDKQFINSWNRLGKFTD